MKTITNLNRSLQICFAILISSFMIYPCLALDLDNLTSVGNPALAYSVRKLTNNYSGPALTVRSGDNNAVVDVYFDANNIVSLNSPVSADGGGAATTKTLGTWIGGNTAFVTKWYDQSGNGRNAATVGTKCKTMVGTLAVQNTSTNAVLGTAIAVKKYTVTVVDAVNNQDSIKIATIPTSSVGATGGTASTAVTAGYPNASSKWQLFNNILVGNGIPEGTMMMGSSQLATTITGNVKVRISNPVTLEAGSTITIYDNVGANYQPGNVIVTSDGYYIGTIQSIGDDGKSIVFTNNSIYNGTFATLKWGVSNEPILVKQGVLQTFTNGMTAIRFVNAGVAGSGFVVPNFTNDGPVGANANLQNVNNMNLFVVAQQKGNAANLNAIFCTSQPTSASIGKLQVRISSSSLFYEFYSTQAVSSSSFTAGTQIFTHVKMLNDSATFYAPLGLPLATNRGKKGILTSTANPPVTTPFDATQVQIFVHSGNFSRNFEGLASELIYWGSTNTSTGVMTDADAAILQTSQKAIYVNTDFLSAIKTVSDLPAKIYPTIGKGVFTIGGECVGANYAIVNLMGQIVQAGKVLQASQIIDLTKNGSGTYLVKVSLNNRMIVRKIVKL
ncbi:MAG: T9SS type A sorting domain-containing protein [Bacteroidales bacterium]